MDKKLVYQNMNAGYTEDRFRKFYDKYLEDSSGASKEIASCHLSSFEEVVTTMLSRTTIAAGRNIRNGMVAYLKAAETVEGAVDIEEKLEILAKIADHDILNLQKQNESKREKFRHFFVSPEHLADELNRYESEYPSVMHLALMLEWMGVPVKDAVNLPKTALNKSGTVITTPDREIKVPEPFQSIFMRYRNTAVVRNPDVKDLDYLIKYKIMNSPFLLCENLRPRMESRPSRKQINPIKPIAVFKEIMSFNKILNEGRPEEEQVTYGIDTASISGVLHEVKIELESGQIQTPEEYFTKFCKGDVHGIRRWLARWEMYEEYRRKPEFEKYFAKEQNQDPQ